MNSNAVRLAIVDYIQNTFGSDVWQILDINMNSALIADSAQIVRVTVKFDKSFISPEEQEAMKTDDDLRLFLTHENVLVMTICKGVVVDAVWEGIQLS